MGRFQASAIENYNLWEIRLEKVDDYCLFSFKPQLTCAKMSVVHSQFSADAVELVFFKSKDLVAIDRNL